MKRLRGIAGHEARYWRSVWGPTIARTRGWLRHEARHSGGFWLIVLALVAVGVAFLIFYRP